MNRDVKGEGHIRPHVRRSTVRLSSAHTRTSPRIDAHLYQAEIPDMVVDSVVDVETPTSKGSSCAPEIRPGQLSALENCIWSPSVTNEGEGADKSIVANEADEVALEFLHKHAGDVSRAEFFVASEVCAGTGYRSQQVLEVNRREIQQLSSWQAAYTKRLEPLGTLESRSVSQPHGYGYPTELVRRTIESPTEDEEDEQEEHEQEEYEEVDEEEEVEDDGESDGVEDCATGIIPAVHQGQDWDRSRRGADRMALRNRWKVLQERVRDIQCRKRDNKATLRECVEVLTEAASLPPPEQSPGEGYVEQAQQSISAISEMASRARLWVASALDIFHPDAEGKGRGGGGGFAGVGLGELQKLLHDSNSLPVRVSEAEHLGRIIASAVDWQHRSDEMLDALNASLRSRSSRGQEYIPLAKVKDLLDKAEVIPVCFHQKKDIQDKLQSATSLAARIRESFPLGRRSRPKIALSMAESLLEKVKVLGIGFPEVRILQSHLRNTQEWSKRASIALDGSVVLRDLQALLSEAAALPIDPGPKLADLQVKMEKALAWLEKVRKAVPRQRATRRNASDMDTDKVDLSHVKSLLNQFPTTGVEMDLKEFSHTNNLIESAEEWMGRVREVLESGESATLESLGALLAEAESIPVTMDEQQLLTVGIKARQWRLRVDETLTGTPATLKYLKDLAKEGEELRKAFPKDARSHQVFDVLDASALQGLLDAGLAWKDKAKKAIADMQAGRPMGLEEPQVLLMEAASINVNLSPEADAIESSVREVHDWFTTNRTLLRVLGLNSSIEIPDILSKRSTESVAMLSPSTLPRDQESNAGNGKQNSDSDMSERNSDGEDDEEDGEQPPEDSTKISQHDLSSCVYAAEKLSVGRSLKEVREMRALMTRINDWTEQCQALCPRRQSKRHVQPSNKPTFAQLEELIAEGLAFPVNIDEEVSRVRDHNTVASSWQMKAQSVLETVTRSLAHQAMQRMELWQQDGDDAGESKEESTPDTGLSLVEGNNDPVDYNTTGNKGCYSSPSVAASLIGKGGIAVNSEGRRHKDASAALNGRNSTIRIESVDGDSVRGEASSVSDHRLIGEDDCDREEESRADKEEELDEAEEANAGELTQLLERAREINVFMPEEMVAERVVEIMQWSRKVRESVSYMEEGFQLTQAKEIVKVGEGVCDLTTVEMGKGLEAAALTPAIVDALQTVIKCYKAKVQAIKEKLEHAETWVVWAKDLLGRDHVKVEDLETALHSAQQLGMENEDLAKKMKAELARGRGWLAKADAALYGNEKCFFNVLKKIVLEGEKIKVCGGKLKELKQHLKVATKWLQRVKKTGIEKGTASITELKALIPEATSIRVNLSEEVRVLKQATCSYCICTRPGDDQGFLVECVSCTEGYHGVCMGISSEEAEAIRRSKEGYKCVRCRISALFGSAEQAMLEAMRNWMPSTCFAAQAGLAEAPLSDDHGRDRWQASQNFAALGGVVRDAMNLPLKKIRTSLGVLSEVDNNIHALKTLPWSANEAGKLQHEQARIMLCNLRILLWCTMTQWAMRKPPSVSLVYDLVSQGQQLSQIDEELLDTLGSMASRASMWEAAVRNTFRATAADVTSPIDVATLNMLLDDAKGIPVLLPLEPKVVAAMEDGGNRYCLCRGPNDGSFMVGCDSCEEWFHGACVNIKELMGKDLTGFECPACAERKGVPYAYGSVDVDVLREQAGVLDMDVEENHVVAADDSGSDESGDNVCTWPPPAAERFFETLDLTELPGVAPSASLESQEHGQGPATEEPYHYTSNMEVAHSTVPIRSWPAVVDSDRGHPVSHFPPHNMSQYVLPSATSTPVGAAQFRGSRRDVEDVDGDRQAKRTRIE